MRFLPEGVLGQRKGRSGDINCERVSFVGCLPCSSQPTSRPLAMIGSFLVLLAYILAATATRSVNVKVSALEAVSNVDDFDVSTTITNTGDETLKLLKDPRTPLSSFATNTFVVTNSEGAYPSFSGIKVRYVPEVIARSGEDSLFAVLAPGESVDVSHEGTDSIWFGPM